MQPDPTYLIKTAGLTLPIIGFYDAPNPDAFAPVVRPEQGKFVCFYSFFKNWLDGEALQLTSDNYGCPGAGSHLFGAQTRSREDLIDFLYDKEGLKASPQVMRKLVNNARCYKATHPNLMIGPLNDSQYTYLRTATFLINPDQLSLFITGARYFEAVNDPETVLAPFDSGCGQLASGFKDLERPQAVIGGTDIAMRRYLPPEILAFTVTKPMFEQLCRLDESSFLGKPFWKGVVQARKED